jgi:predicted amidohydrolase YtcJ
MRAPQKSRGSRFRTLVVLAVVTGCGLVSTTSGTPASCPAGEAGASSLGTATSGSNDSDLLIVGRIMTMDEPPIAEALLISGGRVACVGTRNEVLAAADETVPVVDIGANVAYPGFIDAHAHWIGDRDYYGVSSADAAMQEAVSRGWTSISEQWVNQERLDELEALSSSDALPIRVDAYLALNFDDEFFGDWYTERQPGPAGDRLSVRGLKIHLDDGQGDVINWAADGLTATIARADEAGWQISVHSVSTAAQDMVLDAYEAALGPNGPNPLHHRIDHAIEVSDDQLARMVAMDLVTVIHPDGGAGDWFEWNDHMGQGSDYPAEQIGWLGRWRDFVEAGLHVASASDAPWFFPDLVLTPDIGRPVDHIAGGMDGRGREYSETPQWVLEQLLTPEQGLRAMTLDAAYALGDESRRGRLARGMLGDVTILSGDVTVGSPDEIREMTVIATIVDGIVVHCTDVEVCGLD